MIAIGQPFLYNMPSKLSAIWFPKAERVRSTMIGANAAIAGCIVGFFLPSVIVTAVVPSANASLDETEKAKKRISH